MARKPPKPNAPASTKPAKVKPGSGSEPAGENTQGLITPKTEPNAPGKPSDPPVKAETPQEKSLLEKAGELLEKGEIDVLNKAKGAIQGGIDSAVTASGGGMLAKAVGTISKGAVEILMPTNVIDLIPGGKVLSTGKKAAKLAEKALEKAGKEAAEKLAKETAEKAAKEAAQRAAKEAAEKAAKEAAEREAKQAAGKGGGHSKGKEKKKNKNPCDHPNDKKKKRKYVVYKADEFDAAGNKIGTYVGRTSGAPGESTNSILNRRRSGHHRKGLGALEQVFETDSYAGVRGAEHLYRDKYSTVEQINPIGPKNERKGDYLDCAKSKGVE